jgi:hypothetical protein
VAGRKTLNRPPPAAEAEGITADRARAQQATEGGEVVSTIDQWPVEISLSEVDRETTAEARLIKAGGPQLSGHGVARRNPDDREVTEIGEEIAAARALFDLAHKLLSTAADSIEGITHRRAHLHL